MLQNLARSVQMIRCDYQLTCAVSKALAWSALSLEAHHKWMRADQQRLARDEIGKVASLVEDVRARVESISMRIGPGRSLA